MYPAVSLTSIGSKSDSSSASSVVDIHIKTNARAAYTVAAIATIHALIFLFPIAIVITLLGHNILDIFDTNALYLFA